MAIDGDNGTSTVGGGNTGYNWSGYAEWLAKTKNSTKTCNLIVNYYANGYNGSAAENPPPSSVRSYTGQSVDVRLVVEVASGDTMSNPGYVFVGWATSNNTPTVTYNPGDTISNSWAADYRGNSVTNLYAVWTNQNVITYNPDDNSIEKSAIYQVKQSGQSATLKGATFTRTGYTQTGWATTAGGPKVYDLGGTYSSNNPLSLYPVWQANTYTITYVANEGTGTMADQTVTYDSTFTPRACSFTREGYSFSSWNESQDGKGIRWKVQEYTVDRAENITLYAIWKGNEYTVYYDDNYSRYSDEITGDIVTFESEYAQPLKKAEVSLSPIQSLHGYDNPWPGGGGKNKLPTNYSGGASLVKNHVTYTNTDGVVNVTGTPTGDAYYGLFPNTDGQRLPLPSGTYTISCQETTENCKVNFNVVGVVSSVLNANQHSYTFTLSSDGEMFANILTNGNSAVDLTLHIQIESGSTATSWEPYENICPISGRTGLSVYRTGVNLFPPNPTCVYGKVRDDDGNEVISSTSFYTTTYIPVKASTKYMLKLVGQKAINSARIYYLASNGSWISRTSTIYSTPTTFTTPSGCGRVEFQFSITGEQNLDNFDLYLCEGETATEEPFGNTYALDWTTPAGTVYGGTLDVVTGVLTVDRICVNGGSVEWTKTTGNQYRNFSFTPSPLAKYMVNRGTVISSQYKSESNNTADASDDNYVWIRSNNTVCVKDTSKASLSASDFKTAMSGVQFVYELATPLTYQLSPQEIEALVGTNNVWSDGGPITIVYALDELPQNMPPSTAIFGDIFYTRRNQLSRFGLTFKGWNTVPDGSGEAWLPSGVSMGTYKRTEDAVWNVSHNVTLYAQWDPNVYPFGTVFFNGRNAQDLGIIVEELPSYYYAERAFNHKQVNGKNGDVILDTGRYENVKKVYKVACYDPSRNFYESAVALSTFLHSAGSDYIRLEDSYEPSSYRMAIYEETNEIENLLGKAGRCEITFNCMPQRFLLSGDEEITIPSSGYSIYNPTAFDAKPMIRIQGTGTVTINGRSVQVTENDNDMLVDCENQNAKDLSGADMNYFIYCDEFPILKPGFNTVSYTETIDAVKITPRWWIL